MKITDKMRLDWLQKQERVELYSVGGEFCMRSHIRYCWIRGIRKAIDAAIKSKGVKRD